MALDATVNNAGSLQRALAAGGTIRLRSAAPLRIAEPLRIDRPTRLIGGSLVAPTDGPLFDIVSSSVDLVGVRIRGGAGPGSVRRPGQFLIWAHGAADAPLHDVVVSGCVLTDSLSDAVRLQWCTDSQVVGNRVDHALYAGVMCLSCSRVLVADNQIRDIPLTAGTVDCYGIAFSDVENTAASRSQNCRAVRNLVERVDREGIDTHGGLGITITGNIVVGCARGIAVVSGNDARLMPPQRCLVAHNRIDAVGARAEAMEAVAFRGTDAAPATGAVVGNVVRGYRRPLSLWHAAPASPWAGSSITMTRRNGRRRAFPRPRPFLRRSGFRRL